LPAQLANRIAGFGASCQFTELAINEALYLKKFCSQSQEAFVSNNPWKRVDANLSVTLDSERVPAISMFAFSFRTIITFPGIKPKQTDARQLSYFCPTIHRAP